MYILLYFQIRHKLFQKIHQKTYSNLVLHEYCLLVSTLLQFSSLFSILLAVCLYGNDHMNRAMITKVNPQLAEVTNNLAITKQKLDLFEAAKNNISKDASQLQSLIDEKAKQPGSDKTQVAAASASLTKIISLWKDLKNTVDNSQQVLSGVKNLKEAQKSISRIEFER